MSIITSVFNNQEFVSDAIESILNQTHENVEYIVIDGDSSDGTKEIVASYSHCLDKFVTEKDQGIYDGLNKGISMATGDIIGFLHSDDLLNGNHILAKVINEFKSKKLDGVYGDLLYVDKDNTDRVIRKWTSQKFDRSLLKNGWMPAHPTLFLRRHVYDKHGNFDLKYRISSDYDLMLRILNDQTLTFEYLPLVMTIMRIGGKSNGSIKNILLKSKEDLSIMKKHKVGGFFTLLKKNFSKIKQFI